jgi:hypothetical protein
VNQEVGITAAVYGVGKVIEEFNRIDQTVGKVQTKLNMMTNALDHDAIATKSKAVVTSINSIGLEAVKAKNQIAELSNALKSTGFKGGNININAGGGGGSFGGGATGERGMAFMSAPGFMARMMVFHSIVKGAAYAFREVMMAGARKNVAKESGELALLGLNRFERGSVEMYAGAYTQRHPDVDRADYMKSYVQAGSVFSPDRVGLDITAQIAKQNADTAKLTLMDITQASETLTKLQMMQKRGSFA